MTITDNLLDGARLAVLPGGNEMKIRRLLVIHFTSGVSAEFDRLLEKSQSAGRQCPYCYRSRRDHLRVSRLQSDRWTCGKESLEGSNGRTQDRLQRFLDRYRAGERWQLCFRVSRGPEGVWKHALEAGAISAKHKNGGCVELWEKFPTAQLEACFALAKALKEYYNLDDIVGHEDIAPERKNDPGPAFPMQKLRESVGFEGLPTVNYL